jgi:hypothetical protein
MLAETYHLKEKVERLVSYLPLSHVAANILDIFVLMRCQSATYFADKNALKGTLTDTLKEAQPTLFFGVPRVWEKIQEKMVAIGESLKFFVRYSNGSVFRCPVLGQIENLNAGLVRYLDPQCTTVCYVGSVKTCLNVQCIIQLPNNRLL